MHMIDVMKKLQEIAEDGYNNEDIQRGIDAASKHTVAEAQSPNSKSSDWESLEEESWREHNPAKDIPDTITTLPVKTPKGGWPLNPPAKKSPAEKGNSKPSDWESLEEEELFMEEKRECLDCYGTGYKDGDSEEGDICSTCGGDGTVDELEEDADDDSEEIATETVEVPVNELAELMQLAGYTDYAEKIEEYANEPEEDYMDAEEQLIGLSGGLNGPKKMYAAAAGGDNPMDQEPREVTESTFESFYKKYDKFVAELTESEQDK